jgi:uncharacterized membrane protein HdeD (DUF308 family)
MLSVLARRWWLLALRGLLAILFGILALIWPELTVDVLTLIFAAYVFVDGLFTVISVIVDRELYPRWGRALLGGLLGMAVGVVTFIWPNVTQLTLLILIAAWAFLIGIFSIIAAIDLRKEMEGELLLGLSGVLSILFGLLLVIWPASGLLALIWMIGGYAIVFGVLLILLAFRARGWREQLGTL